MSADNLSVPGDKFCLQLAFDLNPAGAEMIFILFYYLLSIYFLIAISHGVMVDIISVVV